ncbi:MAG: T9SS type A sorting domain-containing protein [Cytophagales bacterium]|nr:T9SS type A sorting domain-containing protein [Cytophagales bacterium]
MNFNNFVFKAITIMLFWPLATVQGQIHFTNYQSIYGDLEQSYLGWQVDMEGDLVVAGNNRFPEDDGFGGAYLFRRHDDTWRTEATLKISEPLNTNEIIEDVQIEGDVVMLVTFDGVYFFEKPDGGWDDMEETAKLNGTTGYTIRAAQFRDNRLLILETSETDDPSTLVSLYEKTGSSWSSRALVKTFSQAEKNIANSCNNCILLAEDFFAFSNIRSDPGKVFIYQKATNGDWPDIPTATYEPNALAGVYRFGQSLATDGQTLFIGSAQDQPNNTDAALFVVEKGTQGWQSAVLSPQLTFDRSDVSNPAFSLLLKGDSLFVGRQFAVDEHSPLALLYPKPAMGWGGLTGDGTPLKLVNGRDQLVDMLMLGWSFDLEKDYAVFGNWIGERKERALQEQGEVAFAKLAATCLPVTEIADPVVSVGATGLNVVELSWEAPGYSFRTEIAYREAGSGGAYSTLLSSGQRELLTNLKPNTTYEYKLRNICGVFGLPDTTAYSAPRQFTTAMGGITELVNVPVRGIEDVDPDRVQRLVIDDSTAVVGLSDFRLLILENQDSVWRRVATLQPSSPPAFHNVAIDGHTIVAANFPSPATPDDNNGQLFIWEKPDMGWEDMEETVKVVIPAITDGQNIFGLSLEISGPTILVNTLQHNNSFSNFLGSVFVVEKTNGKWGENPPAVLTADMNGRMVDLERHYFGFGFYASLTEGLAVASRPMFINNLAPIFTARDDFKRNPLAFVKPSSGWSTGGESFELATIHPGYLLFNLSNLDYLSAAGTAVATIESIGSHLFSFRQRVSINITELAQNGDWAEAPQVKAMHPSPDLFDLSAFHKFTSDRLLLVNNHIHMSSALKKNNITIYHKTSDTWADAAPAITATITNSDGLDSDGIRDFDQSGPFSGFVPFKANTIQDKIQFFTENRYCVSPTNILAAASGEGASPTVTINWESLPTSSSWEVEYRIVGSQEPFQLVPTSEKTVTISQNLRYGTTYEYRVRSLCADYPDFPVSAPTALQQFTTPCLTPTNLMSAAETDADNSFEVSLTWDQPHENKGYNIVIMLGDSVVADLQSTDPGVILNSGLLFNEEYRFQVRSICGSSSEPFYSAFSDGTFTIDEFIPGALKLYPNPTTGRATMEVPVSQIDLNLGYQLVDHLGKTLSTGVITRNNFEIDLTHLSPGIYHIVLSRPERNTTLRVVKY